MSALWTVSPPVLLGAVVAAGSTALVLWWLARRREQVRIDGGVVQVGNDALKIVSSQSDPVVNRQIRYLEAKRGSDEILVLLHGLGLDATDFRPYMVESSRHCIALTMFGFNAEEKDDPRYEPISLESHVQLVGYALLAIRARYPRKRISLVGFSLGADSILFLTRYCQEVLASLEIDRVLLLDPNVDRTTTTISSKIAIMRNGSSNAEPVNQLLGLLESAPSVKTFRYLCQYLYKITAKGFAQIARHAKEVVAIWDVDTPDLFFNLLGALDSTVGPVRVVFSTDHQDQYNRILRGAIARDLDAHEILENSTFGHFELISPKAMRAYLEDDQRVWRGVSLGKLRLPNRRAGVVQR